MQKRTAFFLALLIVVILPTGVQAQGEVKLDFLSVELWSEFDQPSMLVINEFAVSPGIPLPVDIEWRFPKEGNLVAVAYESEGQLLNSPFESSAVQDDWQTITLVVDSYNTYHIEYYQVLAREGNRRSFNYHWFGNYSIGELRLSLSLPGDSVNIQTTPALAGLSAVPDRNQLVGSDVLTDLVTGSLYQFDLAYERDSDELTDPGQVNQVGPSGPLSPETDGRVSVDKLPWIIGGVGIALIGFGMFFYWRSTRPDSGTSKRARKHSRQAQEEPSQPQYCHECGTRANASDRFCRTCGSRLSAE